MALSRRISMERTPEEKMEERLRMDMMPAVMSVPDVPYGLCLCLTEVELEKLGVELDEDVQIGDTLHLSVFAKVTGIKCEDTSAGRTERLELAITDILSLEDENTEGEEAEEE